MHMAEIDAQEQNGVAICAPVKVRRSEVPLALVELI